MAADTSGFVQLRGQVFAWVRETEALLVASRMLVDWHGGASEADSFIKATEPARVLLRGIVRTVAGRLREKVKPVAGVLQFQCSSSTARVVSPLLEVLATPVPDFVTRARIELPAMESGNLIGGFGLFCGAMSDAVYEPFWRDHPSLAPKDWPL